MTTNDAHRTDKTMMTQISPGILRAYLDEDPSLDAAGRADVVEALTTDPAVAACLDELRAERAIVQSIFAPLDTMTPDATATERAFHQTLARTAHYRQSPLSVLREAAVAITAPFRGTRAGRLTVAGSLALVALVLVIVFAPVSEIANATLDQFKYQPDKFAVITLDTNIVPGLSIAPAGANGMGLQPITSGGNAATPGALPTIPSGGTAKPGAGMKPGAGALGSNPLGSLAPYLNVSSSLGNGQTPIRIARNAADVQMVTGRPTLLPTYLPDGVQNRPLYFVANQQTVDASLNVAGLQSVLDQSGLGGAVSPSNDTVPVHVTLPPASITTYGINPLALISGGQAAANQKGIVVIAMATPTIAVDNLDINALASLLAAYPNIPPTLAAQLRTADLSHTLIVPVTADQTVKNGTFINRNPSTLIAQKDGSGAVALWFNRGILYVVTGTYDAATIQKVAQSVK